MLKSSHQSTTEGALLIPVEFGPTAPLADLHSPVVVSPCRRSAELNTDFSVSSCYTSCHYNTRHERELACTCSVSVSGFSQVQVLIKLCPALFPLNWFRQLWFSRVKLRLCLNFWSFQPQWMGRKLHADVNNGTIPSLKVYSSCCMYLYVFVQMSPVCPPPNKLGRLLKNSAGHWHTWSPGNWLMSQKKWCGVCRSVCKQTESSLFHTNSPFYCCSAADPFTSLIFSFYWLLRTSSSWHLRGGIKDWSNTTNETSSPSLHVWDLIWVEVDADVVARLQLGALHVRMSSVVSETTQKWSEWNAKLIMQLILVRFHTVNLCAVRTHYTIELLKGAWVIVAYLHEWAVWDGSWREAHVLLFLPWWCHNQRLPEHKVHSQSPPPDTGTEHQTSRLHGNHSLRACESPSCCCLLFEGRNSVWNCACTVLGHVRLCKQHIIFTLSSGYFNAV